MVGEEALLFARASDAMFWCSQQGFSLETGNWKSLAIVFMGLSLIMLVQLFIMKHKKSKIEKEHNELLEALKDEDDEAPQEEPNEEEEEVSSGVQQG